MASAGGSVIPKPGVPRTLGILNIIFGVLLVLLGLCLTSTVFVAPTIMSIAEKTTKDAQAQIDAREKEKLKSLDEQEAAAKTDEEKKAIQAERADAIAKKPQIAQVDMSAARTAVTDPTIMTYSGFYYGTGLLLHVLLIITGIGLVRLQPWGRTLAIAWASLQILQLVVMLIYFLVVVHPVSQANTDKEIARLEEVVKTKGAGSVEASTLQMTKMMDPLGVPIAIGYAVAGLIYPVIVLTLLNGSGARAACLPKKSDEMEGY